MRKLNVGYKGGPPKANFNENGTSPLDLILRVVDAGAAADGGGGGSGSGGYSNAACTADVVILS